jgi:hypothetical protein
VVGGALVLGRGEGGKAALDDAKPRAVAIGLERELDERRVALDRLLAARVLEGRPAVGEAGVRLDRDDAAVARAVVGLAQDHRAAGP